MRYARDQMAEITDVLRTAVYDGCILISQGSQKQKGVAQSIARASLSIDLNGTGTRTLDCNLRQQIIYGG